MTREEANNLQVGNWVRRRWGYHTGKGYFISPSDVHRITEVKKLPGVVLYVALPPFHNKYCLDWSIWEVAAPPEKKIDESVMEAFL